VPILCHFSPYVFRVRGTSSNINTYFRA